MTLLFSLWETGFCSDPVAADAGPWQWGFLMTKFFLGSLLQSPGSGHTSLLQSPGSGHTSTCTIRAFSDTDVSVSSSLFFKKVKSLSLFTMKICLSPYISTKQVIDFFVLNGGMEFSESDMLTVVTIAHNKTVLWWLGTGSGKIAALQEEPEKSQLPHLNSSHSDFAVTVSKTLPQSSFVKEKCQGSAKR